MQHSGLNRRGIGGNRVIAEFSLKLLSCTPVKSLITGSIIFNARGACLYIPNGFNRNVRSLVFRGEEIINVAELVMTHEGKQVGLFKNLEIKMLGEKHKDADSGLLVKFINLSESQLEKFNSLIDELPVAESDSLLFDNHQKAG